MPEITIDKFKANLCERAKNTDGSKLQKTVQGGFKCQETCAFFKGFLEEPNDKSDFFKIDCAAKH